MKAVKKVAAKTLASLKNVLDKEHWREKVKLTSEVKSRIRTNLFHLPQSGICPDQSVAVTTLESASEVVVAVSVTGPRNSSCQQGANSDSIWVDVVLKEALDDRPIIRSIDGEQLLRIR